MRAQEVRKKLTAEGPAELAPTHKLLIEYMTFGCSNQTILNRLSRPAVVNPDTGDVLVPARTPTPGVPLSIAEAAELVGMRRRTARLLLASPIGSKAMARALNELREGAKALAMQKIIDLVSDPGEGKAADRKVQLEASRTLLGDAVAEAPKIINNTTINNAGVILAPGYVMDLRPQSPGDDAKVIEGEDVAPAS